MKQRDEGMAKMQMQGGDVMMKVGWLLHQLAIRLSRDAKSAAACTCDMWWHY